MAASVTDRTGRAYGTPSHASWGETVAASGETVMSRALLAPNVPVPSGVSTPPSTASASVTTLSAVSTGTKSRTSTPSRQILNEWRRWVEKFPTFWRVPSLS